MVHRPEKSRAVGNPVVHIPRQIIEQESDQPSGEILFQYEEVPPMIQEGHHPEGQEMPHCGIDYQSRNRDEEIGRGVGIVPGAVFGEPHPMSHPLPREQEYIDRKEKQIAVPFLNEVENGLGPRFHRGGIVAFHRAPEKTKFGMSLAKSSRDGFALSGTSRIAGEEGGMIRF